MIDFLTTFPKDLSNASWQKAKSFKDKVKAKTKTGLGDMLIFTEKEWNKLNWDGLHADNAMKGDRTGKYRAAKEIDFAKGVALAEIKGPVALVIKNLERTSKMAHKTAQNPDLSADAVKKAKAISAGLLGLAKTLRDIKLDDFDAKKKRFLELFEMQMKSLKKDVVNLESALKEVIKEATKENWNNKVKQKCRSVGNTLGNFEEFKDIWPTWMKFDGMQADNDAELSKKGIDPMKEAKIIQGFVKEMVPHLEKLKQRIATMK